MFKRVLLVFCFCLFPLISTAEEVDGEIHDELRQVLRGIETAINTAEYEDMLPYFHENLLVTTINQEVLTKKEEIPAYFNKWFGADGYLKKLHIEFTPDIKTMLYADNTIGVVNGAGIENYTLSDTRYFEMKTRWTATVIKDTDGKWKLLTIHIGVDFLNNPILGKAESSIKYFGAGGFLAGMLLCLLLCWLHGRCRSRTSPE